MVVRYAWVALKIGFHSPIGPKLPFESWAFFDPKIYAGQLTMGRGVNIRREAPIAPASSISKKTLKT